MSPFLHDAMYLYALGLNKTLIQNGDVLNGQLMMNNCINASFDGRVALGSSVAGVENGF
jgi:hypothetical protein